MNNDEFRSKLEAELTRITAELTLIGTQDPTTGDWEATPNADELGNADENVEADATEEWGTNRSILTELETRYRNIKRALEKIEQGTFGICEISGEPIEPERLAVNPAARTTIANRDRERELPL
jgi:DnaK suppressor protein